MGFKFEQACLLILWWISQDYYGIQKLKQVSQKSNFLNRFVFVYIWSCCFAYYQHTWSRSVYLRFNDVGPVDLNMCCLPFEYDFLRWLVRKLKLCLDWLQVSGSAVSWSDPIKVKEPVLQKYGGSEAWCQGHAIKCWNILCKKCGAFNESEAPIRVVYTDAFIYIRPLRDNFVDKSAINDFFFLHFFSLSCRYSFYFIYQAFKLYPLFQFWKLVNLFGDSF